MRLLYLDFHCGKISVSQFREELSNLGIQETEALKKLLNRSGGATLKYSEFLKSLAHIDEVYIHCFFLSFFFFIN